MHWHATPLCIVLVRMASSKGSAAVILPAPGPESADVSESVFICSKCELPNTSGSTTPAGYCETCPDGDALCERCCERHLRDAKYKGHAFEPCAARSNPKAQPAGAVASLLERVGLKPTTTACTLHGGAPFLPLACADCAVGTRFCTTCVTSHSAAHPSHALKAPAFDLPALRSRLSAAACARVSGCFAGQVASAAPGGGRGDVSASSLSLSSSGSSEPPLVACARHKAQAVQAELEVLVANTEAAQVQIGATRDALIAQV